MLPYCISCIDGSAAFQERDDFATQFFQSWADRTVSRLENVGPSSMLHEYILNVRYLSICPDVHFKMTTQRRWGRKSRQNLALFTPVEFREGIDEMSEWIFRANLRLNLLSAVWEIWDPVKKNRKREHTRNIGPATVVRMFGWPNYIIISLLSFFCFLFGHNY